MTFNIVQPKVERLVVFKFTASMVHELLCEHLRKEGKLTDNMQLQETEGGAWEFRFIENKDKRAFVLDNPDNPYSTGKFVNG